MTKYIFKRVILLAITLIVIVVVVFFLLQLMTGYPKAIERKLQDPNITEEQRASIIAQFTNNKDAWGRFSDYVNGIFHGNFGINYDQPTKSIPTLFVEPLRYTFMIVGPAFILGSLLGISFGLISGYKRGKWQDATLNFFGTFFYAVPSFVLAIFVIVIARKAGLEVLYKTAEDLGYIVPVIVLPIFVISLSSYATTMYFVRNEVVEVLASDYIAIARAKGVGGSRIFFKHILRNISIPVVSILLPGFVGIILGALIIEVFFGIPGSSSTFINAVSNRETYVVMFSTLFFTSLFLLVQIATDVIYVLLDPRIKLAEASRLPIKKVLQAFFTRKKARKELEVN